MSEDFFLGVDKLSLQEFDGDSELIPLMSSEDEEEIRNEDLPESVSILPLSNTVLFPGVVAPILASREKSVRLIKDANEGNKILGVVYTKGRGQEKPDEDKLSKIGTIAQILKVLKMPDGNLTVVVQGKKRFEIDTIIQKEPYIKATTKEITEVIPPKDNKEFATIVESIRELALKLINNNPNIPSDASIAIKNIESDNFLINFISSNLDLPSQDKQKVLEIASIRNRALKTMEYMDIELQKLQLKNNIQTKVRQDLDQQQKEYFLHQQMKTIQEELGGQEYNDEIKEIRKKATKKKWSNEVNKHFEKELSKFQKMNPQMAEYSTQRNYLELFVDLPFEKYSKDRLNLDLAERILNKDHYGLEKVKERILEYLAVLKVKGNMRSPILCFYGPPGVGKTSLGKSIAKAISRKYVRISLGGLRDEAEIRGHRKTYIGAMPGRIIQSIKKAGTSNPVFVLDEIDKIGNTSYAGDPSSAMLEVLDPEQNNDFYDNFLELGYDLSKVMFVATANSLSTIPAPLRDRMEIIEVNGYTVEEKGQIAKRHLIPKLLEEHGIKKTQFNIGISQITKIIDGYTRESGVRGLEKKLAKVMRSVIKEIASEKSYNSKISTEYIEKVLGPPRFEKDKYESNDVAGVVTGLAWTSVGGEILFIESSISKGSGKLGITGNLGKVMRESATIALEYLKSNAPIFGINEECFEKYDIHIHVPEGATPKDGPSAGITILTSLLSLFTQRKVKKNIAMTGEITLRGKVLPVGGIKEKILAAKRAGIKEIILSKDNRKDIEEIEEQYLQNLKFHYITEMKEIVDLAITNQKVKNPKKIFHKTL